MQAKRMDMLMNPFSKLCKAATYLYSHDPVKRFFRRRLNFWGRYTLDDRSANRRNLLLIVAGYKKECWDVVFPRLFHFVPRASFDVCVVTPGVRSEILRQRCRDYGWSCLSTKANKIALAQNLAIQCHPRAETIFKLDEDIVIGKSFFHRLLETWRFIEQEQRFDLGCLAPVLNVNGYTYRIFLEHLGRLDEYRSRFADTRQSCMNTSAWREPEAAEFLWDLARPFDDIVDSFARLPHTDYSLCPHRFSIGAIMFSRTLWEAMEGFTASSPAVLGVEETDLCSYCMVNSRVIAVAHSVFAGHIGFHTQYDRLATPLRMRQDLLLQERCDS